MDMDTVSIKHPIVYDVGYSLKEIVHTWKPSNSEGNDRSFFLKVLQTRNCRAYTNIRLRAHTQSNTHTHTHTHKPQPCIIDLSVNNISTSSCATCFAPTNRETDRKIERKKLNENYDFERSEHTIQRTTEEKNAWLEQAAEEMKKERHRREAQKTLNIKP